MSTVDWAEPLPENCPPNDATDPNGKVLYRLAKSNPPKMEVDFVSHRIRFPNKYPASNCDACSLSMTDDLPSAKRLAKVGNFKNAIFLRITLLRGCGVIKKTGGPNHWSWWRRNSFNPLENYAVEE